MVYCIAGLVGNLLIFINYLIVLISIFHLCFLFWANRNLWATLLFILLLIDSLFYLLHFFFDFLFFIDFFPISTDLCARKLI